MKLFVNYINISSSIFIT